MDLKELYQDIILEHGKSPRNFGKCEGHNHEAKGHNPLCGDQVHVYLKISKNQKVEELTFEGSGCAISIASTSLMTELVKGKSLDTATRIINEFLNMIKSGSEIKTKDLNKFAIVLKELLINNEAKTIKEGIENYLKTITNKNKFGVLLKTQNHFQIKVYLEHKFLLLIPKVNPIF